MSLGVADFAHAVIFGVCDQRGGSPGSGLRGSFSRGGGRCGRGSLGSFQLAVTFLELVDPILQLLNTVEQSLYRGLTIGCCRRRRLCQQHAGGQKEYEQQEANTHNSLLLVIEPGGAIQLPATTSTCRKFCRLV